MPNIISEIDCMNKNLAFLSLLLFLNIQIIKTEESSNDFETNEITDANKDLENESNENEPSETKIIEISGTLRFPSEIDLAKFEKIIGIENKGCKVTIILDEDLNIDHQLELENLTLDGQKHQLNVHTTNFKPTNCTFQNFILANAVAQMSK